MTIVKDAFTAITVYRTDELAIAIYFTTDVGLFQPIVTKVTAAITLLSSSSKRLHPIHIDEDSVKLGSLAEQENFYTASKQNGIDVFTNCFCMDIIVVRGFSNSDTSLI